MKQVTEVWLRGQNIPDLPALLQPVADALLQANEELGSLLDQFPDELLWVKPGGCASVGFHLLHIRGVLDRLLTYAEGHTLTAPQLIYLKNETSTQEVSTQELLQEVSGQITVSIQRLKQFTGALTSPRSVGRAGLPSTVIGLCTHAAEHTMRHTGQLLVTVKLLTRLNSSVWN